MVYRSFAIASKVERDWLPRSLFPLYVNLALRSAPRLAVFVFPAKPPSSPRRSPCTSVFCRPPTPRQREPSLGEINCVSVYLSLRTPPPPCASSRLAQDSCELLALLLARAFTDAGFAYRCMRVSAAARTTMNVSAGTSHSRERDIPRVFASAFRDGHGRRFSREESLPDAGELAELFPLRSDRSAPRTPVVLRLLTRARQFDSSI